MTKRSKPLFPIPELRVIGVLGYLMVSIDGYVDEEEKQTIRQFLKAHWYKKFGDFTDFMLDVEKVAGSVQAIPSKRRDKVDRILKVLNFKLNNQQKEIVIHFLVQIIEADFIFTKEEENFLDYIKKSLSLNT